MTNLKLGSVVVGIDGSTHSDTAVTWAARYAAGTHRPLTIVHALGGPDVGRRLLDPAEARRQARIAARRLGDHALVLAHRVDPDLRVEVLVRTGDPREVLLDLSEHATLVAVGTRGHGRVASLLLGSVSAAVATHVRCAVAVVRSGREDASGVVAGVSGDGSDRAALQLAADLAASQREPLDAVHAWWVGAGHVDRSVARQLAETRGAHERSLAEAVAGLEEKHPEVELRRRLVEGAPVPELVHRSYAARCVVLGSRRRTWTRTLLGSVSRAVIEHAHATVVVVPA